MFNKGLRGDKYKPFTEEELKEIDAAVMQILEEVGIEVNSKQAYEILKKNGAIVDSESNIVRFPRSMVEDAIDSSPSKVILRGREEKHDLYLEENRVYFGTGGTVLDVLI